MITFHNLRHTFATRLAAHGEPLRTIQEYLGHADANTTQIYSHYDALRVRGGPGLLLRMQSGARPSHCRSDEAGAR